MVINYSLKLEIFAVLLIPGVGIRQASPKVLGEGHMQAASGVRQAGA